MTREQMRFEAAKAAMQGLLSGKDYNFNEVVREAFKYADALLAELDRTAPKPETPQPDDDGWIPHKPGDPMPGDGSMAVWTKLRNGREMNWYKASIADEYPSWWRSEQDKKSHDIIAWKPA